MILSALAVLLGHLLGYTNAIITPLSQGESPTMMTDDIYVYYMNQMFDVTQAVGDVRFTANAGWMRDYKTVLNIRQLEEYYQHIDAMEYINNNTFGMVIDNNNAIIQFTDLEGINFTNAIEFNYFRLGANVTCQDIEVYAKTQKAYIACYDKEDVGVDPGQIFLLELDMTNSSDVRKIYVNQTKDYMIQHRIRLGIWSLPQNGVNETFLILYDQAIAGTQQWRNQWFRYFDKLDTGFVQYGNLVDVTDTDPTMRTLYDIYSFNGQLLIIHSNINETATSIIACDFYDFNASVYCNQNTRKVTSISFGYVGLSLLGNLVTMDFNTYTLRSCPVGSNFAATNWVDVANCEVFPEFPYIAECFIRSIDDNYHAKLAVWIQGDGTIAGITGWSREVNKTFAEQGTIGVLMNRQLYQATANNVTVRRLSYQSLLINKTGLAFGQTNPVTIQASDAQGSASPVILNILLMEDSREIIQFSPNHRLPEVSSYDQSTVYFPLVESDYVGNNLSFEPNIAPNLQGFVNTNSYTTFPINIIYNFRRTGLPDFNEVTFTDNHAIGKDNQNRIFVFSCGADEINLIRCDEVYSMSVSSKTKLMQYSRELGGYVFFTTQDDTTTTLMIYDPVSEDAFSLQAPFLADDTHFLQKDNRAYIFMSVQAIGVVYQYYWSPSSPQDFQQRFNITAANSNMPYFCPNDVYDTWDGTQGFLEIVSYCYNTQVPDQRIFRYNVSKDFKMDGTFPINLDISHPIVCAIGNSYIIGSAVNNTLEGRNQVSDESQFFYYLRDYGNFSQLLNIQCVPDSGMLTVTYFDTQGKFGFFSLWGDSMKLASKRIHSVYRNFNPGTTNLQSFSVKGVLVHVAFDNGGASNYIMTLSKVPVIRLDFLSINTNSITGTMNLVLRNGQTSGAATLPVNITLSKMNNKITVASKAKSNSLSANISLEDYFTITGSVFNASLDDQRPDRQVSLSLTQRATIYTTFVPKEVNQVIFQHIEAHGNYTIALHMDKSFASFFTIFNNNFVFQSVIQPRGGVQAFDFIPTNNGRCLIGYTTAPVSGERLNFILINGGFKVSEFSASGTYDKLRFGQVDSNDNYILGGLNSASGVLDIFGVNVTGNAVISFKLYTISGVTDFDVTDAGSKISFFYLTPEATSLNSLLFSKNNIKANPFIGDPINVETTHSYWLQTVSCVNEGASGSACIINVIGNLMYEVLVTPNSNGVSVTQVPKFGNYDGKYIYIDENYFAMRAVTASVPREYAFLIWKRPSKGGDGNLWAGVSIDGAARPGTDINSGFTPFTLIQDNTGQSTLFAGTHNPLNPLEFYTISTFRLVSSQANPNLLQVYLRTNGYQGYTSDTADSLGSQLGQSSGSSWWPWLVGGIALVVIALIVYFMVATKNKSRENDLYERGTEGGQYKSLQEKDRPTENPPAPKSEE
jgi:hypothetical protein